MTYACTNAQAHSYRICVNEMACVIPTAQCATAIFTSHIIFSLYACHHRNKHTKTCIRTPCFARLYTNLYSYENIIIIINRVSISVIFGLEWIHCCDLSYSISTTIILVSAEFSGIRFKIHEKLSNKSSNNHDGGGKLWKLRIPMWVKYVKHSNSQITVWTKMNTSGLSARGTHGQ